jgi:acyl transferase domain-containing protein
MTRAYDQFLVDQPDTALPEICFTAATGRSHFDYRTSVWAALGTNCERIAGVRPMVQVAPVLRKSGKKRAAKIAFLFTGQGSQRIGMGRRCTSPSRCSAKRWTSVPRLLRPHWPNRCCRCCTRRMDRRLRWTKPSTLSPRLFAFEYALACLWQSWGIQPSMVAGHSVGPVRGMLPGGRLFAGGCPAVDRRSWTFDASPAARRPDGRRVGRRSARASGAGRVRASGFDRGGQLAASKP